MTLETGNWKLVGRCLAAAVCMGLCLWIGSCGVLGSLSCKGVDPAALAERVQAELPGKPADQPATLADALATSAIASITDCSADWRAWTITHELKAKLSNGKLVLESDALSVWPDGGGRVAANLHFIVMRNGRWQSYCFEYVRPGQAVKGDLPRAPCKPGESYETVDPAEPCYLSLTALCRDTRRNVPERANIVKIQ